MSQPARNRIVLAVTGASGMAYAETLAGYLQNFCELHLIVSQAGWLVWNQELGLPQESLLGKAHCSYAQDDLAAPPASGSWQHQGMVVCPCSMASLAAIAHGLGNNLIHRAADVTLKERRPLVLVARETPLNAIHLENMLAATRAGAVVMPASPGFYHRPRTLQELVDQLAGRILDALRIDHSLTPRWGEQHNVAPSSRAITVGLAGE
ncbi:UbiX family flavin prenyltransferase [Desulfonatronum lacustre]|uniref:UbiX family flavin prenyltransferase n=1 Tax=Desulfonatronum lacustre TaxID=66849 RepID=UPI0004BC5488|nr:UbiX family flavin prenyltransferase [Desulfonatronum lacustre]